jgi:DNA adenine methylase
MPYKNKIMAPITFPGSKWRLSHWLLPLFPPHERYFEGFGGGGGLLLNKPKSTVEVWNELDPAKYLLLKVIKEDGSYLQDRLLGVDYSDEVLQNWRRYEPHTEVEVAMKTMICNRQTAFRSGWTFRKKRSGQHGSGWDGAIADIPRMQQRLADVQLLNQDALTILADYSSPDTFCYLDPPYLFSSRDGKDKLFTHDLGEDAAHVTMAEVANASAAKIIISHYDCELYDELYNGWKKVTKEVYVFASIKRQKRVECLWINEAAQAV